MNRKFYSLSNITLYNGLQPSFTELSPFLKWLLRALLGKNYEKNTILEIHNITENTSKVLKMKVIALCQTHCKIEAPPMYDTFTENSEFRNNTKNTIKKQLKSIQNEQKIQFPF